MTTTYVLIDFENVQPDRLASIDHESVLVVVFLGAKQGKVRTDTVTAIQRMGKRADYVQVSTPGRNSLDFHLAFHLGQLSAKDPGGQFYVISKDTDYDPLLNHMKTMGIACQRSSDLQAIALPGPSRTAIQARAGSARGPSRAKVTSSKVVSSKVAEPARKAPASLPKLTSKGRLDRVVENLEARSSSRPSTVKALTGTIKALFMNQLSDKEIQTVIRGLQSRAFIKIKGNKVTYALST